MDLRRSWLQLWKKGFEMIFFFFPMMEPQGQGGGRGTKKDTHILWSLDEGPPAIFCVRS